MKLQTIKHSGTLIALDDMEAEKLKRFKNGEQYEIEIKLSRNPQFHRKVFAFFKFCFDHWAADKTDLRFQDEATQFETFRKHMTVLAGYYTKTFNLDGGVRIEAMSLSYADMEQDEFERCYSALITVALQKIFAGCKDERVTDRLYAFFW